MDLGLNQAVVLLTGGSKGIGLACAHAFAAEGARVAIAARRPEGLRAAQESLERAGYSALALSADLTQAREADALVAKVVSQLGPIDILVNNAGASWGAPAEDHPIEAWDKVMNLNVRGYFLLSQAIAKKSMIPRRTGRIINLASIAGLGGNPPQMTTIAYNTSKGAVINFTKALAAEWGKYNINVNAICPGFFPSKMTKGILENWGVDTIKAHAPLGRIGDDNDLKGLTLLYASDAGKHITGQWLAVDGGVSCVRGG